MKDVDAVIHAALPGGAKFVEVRGIVDSNSVILIPYHRVSLMELRKFSKQQYRLESKRL